MDTIEHRRPSAQPHRVHEMTGKLYSAYRIDGGGMQLAGCHIQDRLFVRFHFQVADRTMQIIVDRDGLPVDDVKISELGMDELVELTKPPAPYAETVEILAEQARDILADRVGDPQVEISLVGSEAVWCKFTAGKLRFEVGDSSVDLPFSGWSRTLTPPPYVCPHTGVRTYHLAATDDGRIAAADQIGICEHTGRRALIEEMETCSVTGRQVLREFVASCAATDEPVMGGKLIECAWCHQRVSPTALKGDRCITCRSFQRVANDDERIDELLERYPGLAQRRGRYLSETESSLLLVVGGWFQRILIVLDKSTLEIQMIGLGNRFSHGFTPIETAEYDQWLAIDDD